jgi:hypothetical protein
MLPHWKLHEEAPADPPGEWPATAESGTSSPSFYACCPAMATASIRSINPDFDNWCACGAPWRRICVVRRPAASENARSRGQIQLFARGPVWSLGRPVTGNMSCRCPQDATPSARPLPGHPGREALRPRHRLPGPGDRTTSRVRGQRCPDESVLRGDPPLGSCAPPPDPHAD